MLLGCLQFFALLPDSFKPDDKELFDFDVKESLFAQDFKFYASGRGCMTETRAGPCSSSDNTDMIIKSCAEVIIIRRAI